ncbi:hypothetical protein [Streptomyces sp. NPDC051662]|uniref:DUF7848 domain-containing protein n=1 Tax=Streptomyces sp. NPDC051662 TaxID=3154750 RepID=UPI00341EAC27
MTTRAVLRYVKHTMRRHPQFEVTHTARCLAADCMWQVGPTDDGGLADDAAMAHTGRNADHDKFERKIEFVAEVIRAD